MFEEQGQVQREGEDDDTDMRTDGSVYAYEPPGGERVN